MANFCRACGAALTPCAKVAAGLVLGCVLLLASWSDNAARSTSAAAAGAPAGAIVANRWQRYTNTRYGVMIDYPADLFAIQPPPPDNAGRGFVSASTGARFSIYSHANALNSSVDELQDEDATDIGDKAAVKQSGRDWYQVVAGKDGDVILHRVLLSEEGSFVHRLEIAYPKAAAAAFEPIVARMTKSFSVDPSIPEKAADSSVPAGGASGDTVKVTTGNWLIHKPSRQYKDLPALLSDDDSAFDAGLGKIDFVCVKASYYILLVQPSVKLGDVETASIAVRSANASNEAAPAPLTFRNLYKTKAPPSRSLDWDADIHVAELSAALLSSIKTADVLELTLAGKSYSVSVPGLGVRIAPFQRYCEQGVVENPVHFEKR